jgi:glycosyltransferase involved in cell wall biosynthesis
VRAVRALDALTARSTRRFFAVSNATRDTYVHELGVPPHAIEVIPNTVDLRQFDVEAVGPREKARAELGCSPDEFVILMAARLVKAKGHGDAIIAAAQLARHHTVKLCIAGEGPDQEQFRQLATALCAPVELLGPRQDIPRLMCAADLFLFPAIIEGLPLVVIEAMAMGLPSLCYDIPENREAGGESVAYSPAGDVPQLIDAVRSLIADPERRRRMGASGRARAEQFSSSFVAARLLRSIEYVLRGGDGSVVAS